MSTALAFQSTAFDVIDQNNQPWLQARQIGAALGYSRPDAILNLYERNKDEFKPTMTRTIEMMVGGQDTEVRIFSLRGCHLLAMFARTPVAKAFRVWVLDVLETLNKAQERPALDTSITPDQQCTLQNIIKTRIEALPEGERKGRGLYPQVWSRFNNHFRLSSYKQLPQSRMGEAIGYLMNMELTKKPKALPESNVVMTQDTAEYLLEARFAHIKSLVREIRNEQQSIYAIINSHRGDVLKRLDARRSVLVNMHAVIDKQFYSVDNALEAAEFHARSMCIMNRV